MATLLLDTVVTSVSRVDNLDSGIADLIAVVATKQDEVGQAGDGAGEIEEENSALLWRLVSRGKTGRR